MDVAELCLAAAEHYRNGDGAGAERLCRQALALDSKNFSALHLLGAICGASGRAEEAAPLLSAARAVNPASASAALNHGLALEALGRKTEALECFTHAATLKPDFAAAHYNRANLLAAPEEALAAYDLALAADANYVEALGNRAGLLAARNRTQDALADYARALQLRPGDAILSRNRGQLLRQIRQPQKALESFDQALAAKPDWAEAWDDRGAALLALGRNDDALAAFSGAATRDPAFVPAHLHKAVTLLLLGRLEEGWPLLELRHQLGLTPVRDLPGPRWSGKEDLNGKRLFIWWEEGLGDVMMLFRYALLAKARGAHVILSAPDNLLGLLGDAGAGVELIGADATPQNFDFHIPLLSLPLAFGTRLETIPAATPYLKPDPARVHAWAQRIGAHGFRIGIVWATTTSRSLGRSFPLAALTEISEIPGVRLISLQKTDGIAELSGANTKVEILDGLDEGPDAFRDSAAVMENLDLVISADTATAHLAGALARPTWLALQFAADWKWFAARADNPWYPGMRLFRQTRADDWTPVFVQMARALPALMRR